MNDTNDLERGQLFTLPNSSWGTRCDMAAERALVRKIMTHKTLVHHSNTRMVLIVLRRETTTTHQVHSQRLEIVRANWIEIRLQRVLCSTNPAFDLKTINPVCLQRMIVSNRHRLNSGQLADAIIKLFEELIDGFWFCVFAGKRQIQFYNMFCLKSGVNAPQTPKALDK